MELWEAQHARTQAMIRLDDGDLPGARQELNTLIGRLGASGLVEQLALARIDRATVLRFANDWSAALDDLDAAESLSDKLSLLARRAVLTNVHLLRAKIRSTAFASVFEATLAQSDVDRLAAMWPDHWMVDELQSHVALQNGDWELAAAAGLRAAAALEDEGWGRGVAACRRRAGEALLALGRIPEALAQLTSAFAFFEVHGPPDLLSETRLALARLESRRGNHDGAWDLARRALDEVESRVRCFVEVSEQQRFLVDKLRYYELAFDVALARDDATGWIRAWTVAERSKSFYLAHLLANADVPLFDGVDPALVEALERMESECDACERRRNRLSLAEQAGPEGLKLEAELAELSQQRTAQLQRIMKANPRWASLRAPAPFDAGTLGKRLGGRIVPLSYFWREANGGATLHIFASAESGGPLHAGVWWDQQQLGALGAAAERLHGQVDDYAELLPEGTTARVLPEELRTQLARDACLLVSPHGRLRGIPLHALPLEGTVVLAHWPVEYVPSLALVSVPTENLRSGRDVLIMGSSTNAFSDPPLPDVPVQLAQLAQVWRGAQRTVVDQIVDGATTLRDVGWPPAEWAGFDVLHFTCHGVFPAGRPLDAALRLGGDAVRGSELFGTKLSARVVALGACSLGQRADHTGNVEVVSEEWVGLYLPLFYAGAKNLLVSLWDANVQVARQVMLAFHEALATGASPPAAYRTALLGVSRKLPARWANWCLVGLPAVGTVPDAR